MSLEEVKRIWIMKYRIDFSKDFVKFLRKHPEIRQIVIQKFELLNSDLHHPALDVKPIVGKKNHLRVSKYRFLYEVFEDEILNYAYKADSCGEAYK